MKILLIPGHGGIIDDVYQTKGKQFHHPNGKSIYEGDFNRKIVAEIMSMCKRHGIPAVNLVPELEDIPMSERIKRANAEYLKDRNSVVVEVHANAGKGTGFEVFTTVGRTKSDPLAELMIDSMERTLRPFRLRADGSDGDRDKERNFYVIRSVYGPAFLIECAFMDTYEPDCRMMLEDPHQFSRAIFNGLLNIQKQFA